jgi:hypothetical protein
VGVAGLHPSNAPDGAWGHRRCIVAGRLGAGPGVGAGARHDPTGDPQLADPSRRRSHNYQLCDLAAVSPTIPQIPVPRVPDGSPSAGRRQAPRAG